jgi:hypothetical protein
MTQFFSVIQQINARQAMNEPSGEPAEGPKPPYEILTAEDAVVHLSWDLKNPPERPKDGTWTRFICVSDTHCQIFPVPDGDVFLHAGDLSHTVSIPLIHLVQIHFNGEGLLTPTIIQGRYSHLQPTIAWIRSLPHQHKVHVLYTPLL